MTTTWTTQTKTLTTNDLLLESSDIRLLEDGSFRLLEEDGDYTSWTNQQKN